MAEAEQMSLSVAVLLYSDKILLIGTVLILESVCIRVAIYSMARMLFGLARIRSRSALV
jgi:hypothetical protein